MKGWLTSREIADLNLGGLPNSKRAVNRLAETLGWKDKRTLKGEALSRICEGRDGGGGLEYHISLLPPQARAQLSAQAIKINSLVAPAMPATPQLTADPTKPERALRRDARLAVLTLADAHFNQNRGLGRVAADADFATKYNDQLINVDAWLRAELPQVSGSSLKRWRKNRDCGRWHAVGGEGRKSKSVLDVANAGDVAIRIGAFLLLQPFLSALDVRDQVNAEFGDQLLVNGKFISLPHERSFQRFIVEWRETNKVFITQHTNPDAFKSKMRLTGGNMYGGYTRVNELWEIDASPADVLLKGGRHSIYLLVDIFSRRIMVHVSKTPRTEASLLLVRKAILAWGVPEELRTDNGSDFTSEAFKRSVMNVGIKQDITAAFSPEQKAAVERVIGTMQRGFCTLLPGFVGHNVTDRKQIEQRRAFAARLGDTDENSFCVDIDLNEFQTYCDRWAADSYAHKIHRALGMTPHEKARSCFSPLRTIGNEHALDILLSPIPEQWRVVGKQGIQFDGEHYLVGSLLPGRRVYCRQHPDDYGTLLCFDGEYGQFLAEAICPLRKGVSPHEVLAAARAERKIVLDEGLKEAKSQSRKIKPRHMVDTVLDMKRRKAIEAAGNVLQLPKRQEDYSSPALESAAEAIEAMQPMHFEAAFNAPSNPISNDNIIQLPETKEQRFQRWLAVERAIAEGADVDPQVAVELGNYQQSPEYKSMAGLVASFGSEWLNA